MKDPVTPADWRQAVDLAATLLAIESSRRYGLVEGGPVINVGRCDDILAKAAEMGIVPSLDAIERTMAQLRAEGVV